MGEGAKVVTTGMQEARENFRRFVDAADVGQQHTVIERHGRPVAVLVPVAWYVAKGGDPREPLDQLAEDRSQES